MGPTRARSALFLLQATTVAAASAPRGSPAGRGGRPASFGELSCRWRQCGQLRRHRITWPESPANATAASSIATAGASGRRAIWGLVRVPTKSQSACTYSWASGTLSS